MPLMKKRKADADSNRDEETQSKKAKNTSSTHRKPTAPEPVKEPSPRPSLEPSSATGNTNDVEAETNSHASKSFQDLGIIQSLCDACTALGYKVQISPQSFVSLILKFSDPDSNTKRSNTISSAGKRPHRACRDWQWENSCICASNSTRSACNRDHAATCLILTGYSALMESPQSSLFGLCLAPTRELAYQIAQAFEALGSLISVKVAVVVGGMDMISQSIALGKKPHIVV